MQIIIQEALKKDIPRISWLLTASHLPADDLSPDITRFYLAVNDSKLVGCIGMEKCEDFGLLRSLAVNKKFQNQKVGKQLVDQVIDHAREVGYKGIYLLTTTAVDYFQKLGFKDIDRKETPLAIQNSSEFSLICPDSAYLMTLTV